MTQRYRIDSPGSTVPPAHGDGQYRSEEVRDLFHRPPAAWGTVEDPSDDDAVDLSQTADELQTATPQ